MDSRSACIFFQLRTRTVYTESKGDPVEKFHLMNNACSQLAIYSNKSLYHSPERNKHARESDEQKQLFRAFEAAWIASLR